MTMEEMNQTANEYIVENGICEGIIDYDRLVSLCESVMQMHKNALARVNGKTVVVSASGKEICSVILFEDAYKINTSVPGWGEKTTYLCSQENDFTVYFVDTLDECIGEIGRIIKDCTEKSTPAPEVDTINWDTGMENILKQLNEILNSIFNGTKYHAVRNPTGGQKNVNIHLEGNPDRVAHIWPHPETQLVDFCIHKSIFQSLKSRMALPPDKDIKTGKYPNWRNIACIDFNKAREILLEMAKLD